MERIVALVATALNAFVDSTHTYPTCIESRGCAVSLDAAIVVHTHARMVDVLPVHRPTKR